MNTIRRFVVAAVFAGLVAPVAHAGVSTTEAAVSCKAEAASRYATGDAPARVKFKGMYGSSALRKVRVQVLPAEGKAFLAVCEVNGKSGEIVLQTPQARQAPEVAVVSH